MLVGRATRAPAFPLPASAPVRFSVPPYVLHERLGAGGQAEVWRATAPTRDGSVAVKCARSGSCRAIDTELEVAARLRHPHVVELLDHGTTRGVSPRRYLAMELAEGTLEGRVASSLDELRAWLRAILLALAHAHARGVVHCDVKPANVLLVAGVPKLADFGIARIGHGSGATRRAAWATSAYAAPELRSGASERIGPWTDLYAVGITALELATGARPFDADAAEVDRGRGPSSPPAVPSSVALPPSFGAWLDALARDDVGLRPQRARDALDALEALEGNAPLAGEATVRSVPSDVATCTLPLRTTSCPEPVSPRGHLLAPAPRRAIDRSWAERSLPEVEPTASMLALRAMPVVGRDADRDALWARLGEVARERVGRLCVVRGPAGVGKRHLAAWLGAHAHETAAANVLALRHGGLRGMWLGYLGCGPDASPRLPLVVERALAGHEVDPVDRCALAACLGAPDDDAGARRELVALSVRLLPACATRPLVLVVDGLEHGTDGLALVRALIASPAWAHVPMLLVAIVSDDVAAGRELLTSLPAATTIRLAGLDEVALHALLTGPLGIAPATARRIAPRLDGSPSLAVQQVAEWAERGALVRGPDGFELASELLRLQRVGPRRA